MNESNLILALQSLGSWLVMPMKLVTFLGKLEFHLLFTSALYWCVDATLGMRVTMLLLLSSSANELLKLGFRAPRPYWIDGRVRALDGEQSFSFPSGHAQHALAVWGLIGLSHPAVRSALAILVLLISVSRVYLAVHFPRDVLAGWLVGAIVLALFARLEDDLLGWLRRRSLILRLLGSALPSLIVLVLGAGAFYTVARWQLPSAWVQTALLRSGEEITPLSPDTLVGLAGAWLGAVLGWAAIGFQPMCFTDGSLWQRLARYGIGWLGVATVWFLSGLALGWAAHPWSLATFYLRAALVGGWFSVGAPAAFVRLRLAEAAPPTHWASSATGWPLSRQRS